MSKTIGEFDEASARAKAESTKNDPPKTEEIGDPGNVDPFLRLGKVRRPLAPGTYLLRNLGKTGPLIGVIMLAVMLVAGIISMIDSIPYSIRTTYNYTREMVGIVPRGDQTDTSRILREVKKQSPVPIQRIVVCRVSKTEIQSIVGKWQFYVLGLTPEDMAFYMKREHVTGLDGRLPHPGAAEAVISDPVARNLGIHIGSTLLGPLKDQAWAPVNVTVVGIAHTDRWMIFNPIDFQKASYFPSVDVGLVFARNLVDQDVLDHWAEKHFKGRPVAILAYFQIEKETREMFKTLFEILDVVIGTLVLVITFMMGMLMNIYQTQRLVEFGLLQAIGYTKRALLRRVMLESTTVVLLGWILGVALAFSMLNVVRQVLMVPRAFGLDTMDPLAFEYTIPLPITILAVATLTVILRFRKFDPVGVVERRLV